MSLGLYMAKKFLLEFRWMERNMIAFSLGLSFCCCIWLIFHAKEKSLGTSKAYQFLSILRHIGISECFNPSLCITFLFWCLWRDKWFWFLFSVNGTTFELLSSTVAHPGGDRGLLYLVEPQQSKIWRVWV